MNVLFVHNNFPAQYRHLAARLATDASNCIAAIGSSSAQDVSNVILIRYELGRQDLSRTHPFARRFDLECRRAEQVLYAANDLSARGFQPDVIMVHSGWGENLPLRSVFPKARIAIYCEFYYRITGQDVDFDPEFPDMTIDGRMALHIKNATQLLGLADADIGISPTQWQRSTFPREFQDKISVIHEGIDTRQVAPDPLATVTMPSGKVLRAGEEILTFVSRDLEPLRGYHVFMRALPKILAARPAAEIIIVGRDGTSYGMSPPPGTTWKHLFLEEVRDRLDLDRVHFLGPVAYDRFLSVLQVSAAHIYLTYPFVLSWSFVEAMSAGCLIITGDVGPTRELLDETCGCLVPFHDSDQVAERAIAALASPAIFLDRRAAARARAVKAFDLNEKALPAFETLLNDLLAK